jgi:protease IV
MNDSPKDNASQNLEPNQVNQTAKTSQDQTNHSNMNSSKESAFNASNHSFLNDSSSTYAPNQNLAEEIKTINHLDGNSISNNFENSKQNPHQTQGDVLLNEQGLLLKVISHHLDNLNKELRISRRGRWLGRIMLWVFLMILAFVLFGSHLATNESMVSHNHTAVIEIKGEIAAGEVTSADNIKYSIQQAFENENSRGIILKINSPGGSPVQAGMIYDEIMRQKQKYPKKHVYAVVEEICASGAYYIAAAADSIYVDKASIIGSIGVLMDGFGFDKTMEKFGVQRRLYTAGANKGMLDPFSPENPKQKEYILEMLGGIHQQFITAVKKGRGSRLKFEKNPEMFSGLFWTGEKSIELGLSDGYGYVEDIADRLIREKQLVDYTMQEDFTDKIAKRFGASLGTYLSSDFRAKFLEGLAQLNASGSGIH